MGAKHATWIAGAMILTLVLGLLGRGNWGHQVISLGILLWFGIPLLIIAGALALKRDARGALVCLGTAGVIALQLAFGMAFLYWDIDRSQRYCESLVPILDEIYLTEHRYPLTLEDEPRLPPPHTWQFDTGLINYYSDGATFTFEVANPAEIFAGFIYRHDARRWEEWRD